MKFLIILMGIVCLLTSLSFADYPPPVQRNISEIYRGHNATNDESARECVLDQAILRSSSEEVTALLFFHSDWISKLTFHVAVPAKLLPLQEGSIWKDFLGNEFKYLNGEILGVKVQGSNRVFNIQIAIDPMLKKATKASAQSDIKDNFPSTYLTCEF